MSGFHLCESTRLDELRFPNSLNQNEGKVNVSHFRHAWAFFLLSFCLFDHEGMKPACWESAEDSVPFSRASADLGPALKINILQFVKVRRILSVCKSQRENVCMHVCGRERERKNLTVVEVCKPCSSYHYSCTDRKYVSLLMSLKPSVIQLLLKLCKWLPFWYSLKS